MENIRRETRHYSLCNCYKGRNYCDDFISYPQKAKYFVNVMYFLELEEILMNCINSKKKKKLTKQKHVKWFYLFLYKLFSFPRNRKYFNNVCYFNEVEKNQWLALVPNSKKKLKREIKSCVYFHENENSRWYFCSRVEYWLWILKFHWNL